MCFLKAVYAKMTLTAWFAPVIDFPSLCFLGQ